MKQKDQILFFSWFPRTNLHLREIYSFLKDGSSDIPQLEKRKLKSLRSVLKISEVKKGFKNIEYVSFSTSNNIFVKIHADGLVFLKKETSNENSIKDKKILEDYYTDNLSRALIYIFSIGAPILYHKNIWDVSNPSFLIKNKKTQSEDDLFHDDYMSLRKIDGDDYEIFYDNLSYDFLEDKVCEVAFLKILKDTIHTFLNVHREVWDSIEQIYSKEKIYGRELENIDKSMESYRKTNNKIKRRLKSFYLYIQRRLALNASGEDVGSIKEYIESKYGFLEDSLSYVSNLWEMTENYIEQTSIKISNIKSKINNTSITNIAIIAIIGVGSSIMSLLTKEPPQLNEVNFIYLVLLIMIGYVANIIIKQYYSRKIFKINK